MRNLLTTIKFLNSMIAINAVLKGKLILQPVKLPVLKGMLPYSKQ